MEIEFAASRTSSISNLPAFMAEHLRRRFARRAKIQTENGKKGISQSLKVGKGKESSSETYEEFVPEPLTEEFKLQMLESGAIH